MLVRSCGGQGYSAAFQQNSLFVEGIWVFGLPLEQNHFHPTLRLGYPC